MNLDDLTKKYKRYCGNCNTRFSIEYDEDGNFNVVYPHYSLPCI